MSRYMLDTSALIDFSKGFEPSTQRVLQLLEQGSSLGVCAVNVTEFYAGVLPGTHPDWDEFIHALEYWEITRTAAIQAGVWRKTYAGKGRTLSTTDTLVAAVARERAAILLTDNDKHYPMPEIRVRSLRVDEP